MPDITADDQRLVEKNIFCLFRRDSMAFPILLSIRVIPITANAIL
jgi:hypothetical protein